MSKLNHPGYVAYQEVADKLSISLAQCKAKYKVSKRINHLSTLVNFLQHNLNLVGKFLTIEKHGHLVTIKCVDWSSDVPLDEWYFRCSTITFDEGLTTEYTLTLDSSASDKMETYFIAKELCVDRKTRGGPQAFSCIQLNKYIVSFIDIFQLIHKKHGFMQNGLPQKMHVGRLGKMMSITVANEDKTINQYLLSLIHI